MIAFIYQTIVQYIHFLIPGLVVFDLSWHWIIVQAREMGWYKQERTRYEIWNFVFGVECCMCTGTSLDGRDW